MRYHPNLLITRHKVVKVGVYNFTHLRKGASNAKRTNQSRA